MRIAAVVFCLTLYTLPISTYNPGRLKVYIYSLDTFGITNEGTPCDKEPSKRRCDIRILFCLRTDDDSSCVAYYDTKILEKNQNVFRSDKPIIATLFLNTSWVDSLVLYITATDEDEDAKDFRSEGIQSKVIDQYRIHLPNQMPFDLVPEDIRGIRKYKTTSLRVAAEGACSPGFYGPTCSIACAVDPVFLCYDADRGCYRSENFTSSCQLTCPLDNSTACGPPFTKPANITQKVASPLLSTTAIYVIIAVSLFVFIVVLVLLMSENKLRKIHRFRPRTYTVNKVAPETPSAPRELDLNTVVENGSC